MIIVSRRPLKVKWFDLDLPWVGRFKNIQLCEMWKEPDLQGQEKYLKFPCLTIAERLKLIRAVRGGGSISPEVMQHLQSLVKTNQVVLEEREEVGAAEWSYEKSRWSVTLKSNKQYTCDHLWLSTGK